MLYKDSIAKLRVNNELTHGFEIKIGVMQGSIILFNILFDFIVRRVIDNVIVIDAKFSYGSNDFFHKKMRNMMDLIY